MSSITDDNDRVFLLRGRDGEIMYIDDPDTVKRLDAIVEAMEGKSEAEIAEALRRAVDKYRIS